MRPPGPFTGKPWPRPKAYNHITMRIRDLKEQLDKLDHWPIMEKLLGFEVKPRQMITSPLREGDKHPSFGFFRNIAGQAKWKDFAMDNGDVYQMTQMLRKETFVQAVKTVAQLAGLMPGRPAQVEVIKLSQIKKIAEQARAKCSWEIRDWSVDDWRYWRLRYAVGQEMMEEYQFMPCGTFIMITGDGRELVYHHTMENPMYVIIIGQHAKLYRPMNPDRKYKYIGNTDRNDIFGQAQLQKLGACPTLLITAGQKDALVAMSLLKTKAIAFNSESTVPDDTVMYSLFKMVSGITFVLYDNDETGRKYMKRLTDRFPFLQPIDLQGITKFGSKDLADMALNREGSALLMIRNMIHHRSQ